MHHPGRTEPHDGVVVAVIAPSPGLPAVVDLALVAEFVWVEERFLGVDEVLALGEELVVGGAHAAAERSRGEIGKLGELVAHWGTPCRASVRRRASRSPAMRRPSWPSRAAALIMHTAGSGSISVSAYAACMPDARKVLVLNKFRPDTATTTMPFSACGRSDTHRRLAVQGLLVEAALAHDHQVDTAQMRLEVDEFEDEAPPLQNEFRHLEEASLPTTYSIIWNKAFTFVVISESHSLLSRCRHCWYSVRTPDQSGPQPVASRTMQPPLLGTRSTDPSAPCGCACWRRAIALCHGVIRRLREVCRKRGRPCGRPPGSRVDIRLRCPGSAATRQRGRAARCCCGRAPQNTPYA